MLKEEKPANFDLPSFNKSSINKIDSIYRKGTSEDKVRENFSENFKTESLQHADFGEDADLRHKKIH